MCLCNLYTRYVVCLYWAVTTLTTIGFGDILPITAAEYMYTTFCMCDTLDTHRPSLACSHSITQEPTL